jgi:DMSO/TMAO reductase YedYZ molybdopterin-dependent catalytic subunit
MLGSLRMATFNPRKDVQIRFPNPDVSRVPPNQFVTREWPVLHFGPVPRVDPTAWKLRIWGEVEKPTEWTLEQFSAIARETRRNDIHCVTHWTRLDNDWRGVPVRTILEAARPTPRAHFVVEHAVGGWTTNVPIEDFDREENLFALEHGGTPLTQEHGGPVRVVIPHLYFWKSAKWVAGIELLENDRAGFWEENGYHMHGDPWKEERFREKSEAGK